MCNICNIRLPQAVGDVISSIGIGTGIGTTAADSIGYRAPARYRSNPTHDRRENSLGARIRCSHDGRVYIHDRLMTVMYTHIHDRLMTVMYTHGYTRRS